MNDTVSHKWAARTAVAGTVFIALGAFWLSFTALTDLAARSGIEPGQAWAWPLIVDGIIVVATVSVVALGGQRQAWYPWMLLAGGALISVTANAIHAIVAADANVPDVLAASVAAVPPLVLLAITHLTVILTRAEPLPTEPSPAEIAPVLALAPETAGLPKRPVQAAPADMAETVVNDQAVRTVAVEPAADRRRLAVDLHEQGVSNRRIAQQLAVHPATVGRWLSRPELITSATGKDNTP